MTPDERAAYNRGRERMEDLLAGFGFQGAADDSIPRQDPVQEAHRLARQWRRLSRRMHKLWPDDKAA